MKYYRFKTFRTSYYFPEVDAKSKFLYGVYHPYGSLPVKLYWKLFTSCKWVRALSAVDEKQLEFPYRTIMDMCPANSRVSFNLGTPSAEQKISMLGYLPEKNDSFFAKYSTKEKAKQLSRNEIRVLKELEGLNLAPSLLDVKDYGNEVFFVTSRVSGTAYNTFDLSEQILNILLSLGKVKQRKDPESGLLVCLSHGDFCPWNMLQDDGNVRMIDWEMADARTLGYDLFMFLIHVQLVMGGHEANILSSLAKNEIKIQRYFQTFGVSDYRPYLVHFLNTRLKEERGKGHQQMVQHYQNLILSI